MFPDVFVTPTSHLSPFFSPHSGGVQDCWYGTCEILLGTQDWWRGILSCYQQPQKGRIENEQVTTGEGIYRGLVLGHCRSWSGLMVINAGSVSPLTRFKTVGAMSTCVNGQLSAIWILPSAWCEKGFSDQSSWLCKQLKLSGLFPLLCVPVSISVQFGKADFKYPIPACR